MSTEGSTVTACERSFARLGQRGDLAAFLYLVDRVVIAGRPIIQTSDVGASIRVIPKGIKKRPPGDLVSGDNGPSGGYLRIGPPDEPGT